MPPAGQAQSPYTLTHTHRLQPLPSFTPPTTLKNVALLNGVSSVDQPQTDVTTKIAVASYPAFGQTFVPPAAPNTVLSSFSFYWDLVATNAGHNVQAVRDALQIAPCGWL